MTLLATCINCRRWTRDESTPFTGDCGSEKWIEDANFLKDGVRYWSYDGHSAGFETGEDFGCVHFEADVE